MRISSSLSVLLSALIVTAPLGMGCGGDAMDSKVSQSTVPVASISFLSHWYEHVAGELRQGGRLVLHYDLARLPQCRGTHNGHPAWDIVAYALFAPGGQVKSGSVRRFKTKNGVPTTEAESVALTLDIPQDATGVEIWFKNFTGAGSSCEAWDSRFGANYRYAINPPSAHPRCAGIQRWKRINSDMPYRAVPHCMDYDIAENHDANHCELYLSEIAHGYMGHYGIPNRWVEATFQLRPLSGTVRGVGLFTRIRDKQTGTLADRVTFARSLGANRYQSGLVTLRTAMRGNDGYAYDIEALAYFVDLERSKGKVVRLWQSRHGANYSMGDAFSSPTTTRHIPYGNVQLANSDAPIFDVMRFCRQ